MRRVIAKFRSCRDGAAVVVAAAAKDFSDESRERKNLFIM